MLFARAFGSLALALVACLPCMAETVRSQTRPGTPWKECETRTIASLPNFTPGQGAIPLTPYGGRADHKVPPGGFFRVKQIGGRWWLIDPDGGRFIHAAVCNVAPQRSPGCLDAFQKKFKDYPGWAATTSQWLHDYGFNGTGNWTSKDLRQTRRPLAYTVGMSLMADFGKKLGVCHPGTGHFDFDQRLIPVFHPEFPAFCDQRTAKLEGNQNDRWLVGYFSDNELPFPNDLINRCLAIDANHPVLRYNRQAAEQWLIQQKGTIVPARELTPTERDAFNEHFVSTYLRITTAAIRKHDPNHLCLGPRFWGSDYTNAGLWRAAGQSLDAIAINYYHVWGPKPEHTDNWIKWSQKPFMVTEFYTKGADAGMANTTGAGWVVPTQRDRGLFYQHYVLGLLECRACVGWHWFKYQDNDPANTQTDPSNRDSNKGLVNVGYAPYIPLLDLMKELNQNIYPLIDYFDSRHAGAANPPDGPTGLRK